MKSNCAFALDFSNTTQSHDFAAEAMLRGMGRFSAVEGSALVNWSVLRPSQQEIRMARYAKAAQYLESWLAESTDYDAKVGAILDSELNNKVKLGSGEE